MNLRRRVVEPRARIGDLRGGVARRRDDEHLMLARRFTEGMPQVPGGSCPRVGGQIHEGVDQWPAGAIAGEGADQAVGVDSVGGPEIDHAKHILVRKRSRGGERGRLRGLECGALRERVARVVVRHAQELGAI